MSAGTGDRGPGTEEAQPQAARHFALGPWAPVPGPQRGFSLLEVIAAMLLLAVAFTALMQVAGSSISLTRNATEHSQAAMWARSALDSAFVGEPIQPGSSSGRFNQTFRWQLNVSRWNQGKPVTAPLQLYQLDLNVLWGPPAHPQSAHFRTLRLGGAAATDSGAGADR